MNNPGTKANALRDSLRRAAYRIAPRTALDAYLRIRALREASRLVAMREAGADVAALVDELLRSHFFRLMQKKSEILRLMEIVRELRPSIVCEIGAAKGGTAFLFAHAAASPATLISVDLAFNQTCREAISRFARLGQSVICIEGDSHSPSTPEAIRARLQGGPVDLLYLDGDHAYESVAADFRTYAPLVRRGGLIVFHDIVPDFRARFGKQTSSDAGGVPQFWRQIKSSYTSTEEIIEDEEQDGFGMGVLRWDGQDVIRS